MGFPASEIADLRVRGQIYKDWTSIQVTRTFGEPWSYFTFECTEDNPMPTGWAKMKIVPGDPVQIYLGGQLALTGFVNKRQAAYSAQHHGVQISGRSSSQDGADASIPLKENNGGEFRNQTLQQIMRKVYGDFNIGVTWMAGGSMVNLPFKLVQVAPGETPWNLVERLARNRGVVIGDDASGNIVAVGGGSGPSGGGAQLIEGRNILIGRCTITDLTLTNETTSLAQANGDDQTWGKQVSQITGLGSKLGFLKPIGESEGRIRKYLMVAEHGELPQGNQGRADQEVRWRGGVQVEACITVYGWHKDGGGLWTPPEQVMVRSPMLLLNQMLALKEAVFTQDSHGGTRTELILVRPEFLGGMGPDLSAANG